MPVKVITMLLEARWILETAAATLWGDTALPQSFLRAIAGDPDGWLQRAATRPLKIAAESLVLEFDLPLGGRTVRAAVKQDRPRSFWKALARFARPAKAMRNWQKAEFLRARGVATPRPLLACRPRGWPASNTSILATEWIAGENLHLFGWRIATLPVAARLRVAAQCAELLGQLIGRLHASGAVHRDLKPANLLVAGATPDPALGALPEGQPLAVWLVDLDGLRIGPAAGLRRRARDLARLAAGLAAHPWLTRSIMRRFLRAYLRESSQAEVAWKPLWRAIARSAAALLRRKARRGQPAL
jgi:tRNA A-37 threonylcarbamoyl transferase component Bud32